MNIHKLSSSMYNQWDMCQQAYFLEYLLKWKPPSNIKADKGSIVHKVLEILAKIKLGYQNGEKFIEDEMCEQISVPDTLSISSTELDNLTTQVYNHYTTQVVDYHPWSPKDLKDCKLWVHKTLDFDNGRFHPYNLTIVQPEKYIKIDVKEKWGEFTLRGIIDLVIQTNENTYELVDWKSGRRWNWTTNEEKTYEKLQVDPQLRIYHYLTTLLFPSIKNVLVTIFYINDGGPFTICLGPEDVSTTKQMIKNRFLEIQSTQLPKLSKSWKCNKFCHFGKTTFENTCVKPIIEFREDHPNYGKYMTKCEQLSFEFARKGVDVVQKEYLYDKNKDKNK